MMLPKLMLIAVLVGCGGSVDVPGDGGSAADAVAEPATLDASDGALVWCAIAANPFALYRCDTPGVVCACPSCAVADAGAGNCDTH